MLSPSGKAGKFTQGVAFSEEERARPTAREPPETLSEHERQVRDQRGDEPAGREVGPEEDLGVPRHPSLEGRPGMVVAGGDLVEDPAARGEDAVVARPAEPEGEIDVLVIRLERRIEGPGPSQRRGAVEGTRPAVAEAAAGDAVEPATGTFAVAAVAGPADARVRI